MLSSRHGFVFQVRDVWFSLKGFKFPVLGVSVLKKINFAKPEVEFSKNIKIQAVLLATALFFKLEMSGFR